MSVVCGETTESAVASRGAMISDHFSMLLLRNLNLDQIEPDRLCGRSGCSVEVYSPAVLVAALRILQ